MAFSGISTLLSPKEPYGPPPGMTGPPPKKDAPVWLILVAVGVMLSLVAAVLYVVMHASTKPKGPSYPHQWDSRVLPYVHIAEKERGLTFKHPVYVRFLAPKDFEKTVTTDEKDLDKTDRREIKQFEGLMRAFGLVGGDVDLFDAFNEASGAGILAYYSFEDKRITVRGDKLTLAVRATLVHELTHVLQDQYFDLGDRMEKLGKASEKGPTDSRADVLQAISEGDADRVEQKYRRSLPAKQRRALRRAEAKDQQGGSSRLSKLPKIVVTLQGAPYVLGDELALEVAGHGGDKALDRLYADPPEHETALFDPTTVLTHKTGAIDVARPKLESGEKKFDYGELGVLTWYFMLAERLPLDQAFAAAEGWGGDSYVAYEKGDQTCARLSFQGRTPAHTALMQSALRGWVGAGRAGLATVSRDGNAVSLRSCDPGASATRGKDASSDAMALLQLKGYLGRGMLDAHWPPEAAGCFATGVIEGFPAKRIMAGALSRDIKPADAARVRQIAMGCRKA